MSEAGSAEPIRARDIADRVDGYDWAAVAAHLDAHGWATLPGLLAVDETAATAALYDDDGRFRSHIQMARHGFGHGEYKYFAYPLPDGIAAAK